MISPSEPGFVLVDKLPGKSSFRVVRSIRRIFGVKKVGHAGTLDPFASGLLVIGIGRPATRLIGPLMEGDKTYIATVALGKVSSTQDPEGEIRQSGSTETVDAERTEEVLAQFRGVINQTPPHFSALKHKGKPLYHYARQGIKITKAPREVTIHELRLHGPGLRLDGPLPSIELLVRCSKGTYIRSLAEDIGTALGCGAYLSALRRTQSGFFSVTDSIPGGQLEEPEKLQWVREQRIEVEQVEKLLQ